LFWSAEDLAVIGFWRLAAADRVAPQSSQAIVESSPWWRQRINRATQSHQCQSCGQSAALNLLESVSDRAHRGKFRKFSLRLVLERDCLAAGHCITVPAAGTATIHWIATEFLLPNGPARPTGTTRVGRDLS